jgi:hypothetical protein
MPLRVYMAGALFDRAAPHVDSNRGEALVRNHNYPGLKGRLVAVAEMPQVYDKNSAREGPNVSAATSLGPQMTKWLSLGSRCAARHPDQRTASAREYPGKRIVTPQKPKSRLEANAPQCIRCRTPMKVRILIPGRKGR